MEKLNVRLQTSNIDYFNINKVPVKFLEYKMKALHKNKESNFPKKAILEVIFC